ncbi:MAG: glycosyltransferase family 2 protein [Candidatus Solibacter usitatus]|nr:glycosyltransferase family 2 protein [Candidatus Solibacter usitatus]
MPIPPSATDVDIVVPIYNEAACLDELLERLTRACPSARLIFVDNGSTDGTLELLAERGVDTVKHATNEGYGKSLRDGIALGTRPIVLTIDADLEYPPESAPALLAALRHSPVVYGSRFMAGASGMSLPRRLGNRALTVLFNWICRQNLTDLYTGIKAFRREVFDGVRFRESGFDFVVEFAVYAARNCRIAEVAVPYHSRASGRSKMRHVPDGLRALAALVKWRWLAI